MRFLGVTVRTFSISYGYSGRVHAIQFKKTLLSRNLEMLAMM
jgi:hypothetical protein